MLRPTQLARKPSGSRDDHPIVPEAVRCAAMHTNHRRRNKFRAKQHGCLIWPLAYSLVWWKRDSARKRRAEAIDHMRHGRFDDLIDRLPRDIYWRYW